jgi:hypothetical protein
MLDPWAGGELAARIRRAQDRLIEDTEPCLLCGAPIDVDGNGHDDSCMGLDE